MKEATREWQVDHVDPGKLGGLCGRAGGGYRVPRWAALPRGLLPRVRKHPLQLLQPTSGHSVPSIEWAAGQTMRDWWPLRRGFLLHPHRVGDL